MDSWSYQDAQAFALSWGGVYFLIMFAVALAYAMWPSKSEALRRSRAYSARGRWRRLMAGDKKHIDEISGTETTGHEWDGIKELNTPLPRWWLFLFFACIVWAIGYWILMPSWPLLHGYTHGLLNHSQRDDVTANIKALNEARAAREHELTGATLAADPGQSGPAAIRPGGRQVGIRRQLRTVSRCRRPGRARISQSQ